MQKSPAVIVGAMYYNLEQPEDWIGVHVRVGVGAVAVAEPIL